MRKEKLDKLDVINIKKSCTQKETIKKVKELEVAFHVRVAVTREASGQRDWNLRHCWPESDRVQPLRTQPTAQYKPGRGPTQPSNSTSRYTAKENIRPQKPCN